jgi:hypothetical protein
MSGQLADVSDALLLLFRDDFDPRLPREVHQDSNEFRRRYCYNEDVDKVLRKWRARCARSTPSTRAATGASRATAR